MCFFFEIRRIEELQDSNRSPGREEVGRRTLGAIGGFLLPFFYRASFQLFTQHFLLFYRKASKVVITNRKIGKIGDATGILYVMGDSEDPGSGRNRAPRVGATGRIPLGNTR